MTKAKKPGTPVSDTIKRSIRRNMQRGIWGSKGPRRSTGQGPSCSGSSTSMTGLDLGTVNPNGYSTIANGAWAWHVEPEHWFERWVPKPVLDESPHEWVSRIMSMAFPEAWPVHATTEGWVATINAEFAHLDWIWPPRPR